MGSNLCLQASFTTILDNDPSSTEVGGQATNQISEMLSHRFSENISFRQGVSGRTDKE